MIRIRDALPHDAQAACEVIRRSISELCDADHRNNPAFLNGWLATKTPERFMAWIRPGNSVLVVVESDRILAVGSVTDDGRINNNYVAPEVRSKGIGRALLNALEVRAAERGSTCAMLISTEAARKFYHSAGYVETGPPTQPLGMHSGYPMSKALTASQVNRCERDFRLRKEREQ